MDMERIAIGVAVGAAVLFVGIPLLALSRGDGSAKPNRALDRYTETMMRDVGATPASAAVVTMAEFLRLRDGMSYAEVAGIIEAPGTLAASNTIPMPDGPLTTESYTWTNADHTSIMCMFQGGKLMMKSQFGLK